jgi:O-acetyl-ADP-ribose deacetylase (regulator of RNase III)
MRRSANLADLVSLPLGGAVITCAGRLPFKSIIHVAGINIWWRLSDRSICDSVWNASAFATEHGFQSIAFPLVDAGTGGGTADAAPAMMEAELPSCDFEGTVRIVRVRCWVANSELCMQIFVGYAVGLVPGAGFAVVPEQSWAC